MLLGLCLLAIGIANAVGIANAIGHHGPLGSLKPCLRQLM